MALRNSNLKQMSDYTKKRIMQIRKNVKSQKGLENKVSALKEELNKGIDKKTKMCDIF